MHGLGLCTAKSAMPAYIAAGGVDTLRLAVNMLLMYSFADLNMGNYPPNAESKLAKACTALVASPTVSGLKAFLLGWAGTSSSSTNTAVQNLSESPEKSQHEAVAAPCYNLSTQLPAGHLPTISGGDWSGVGTGANGLS